jgi:hypothetical protein
MDREVSPKRIDAKKCPNDSGSSIMLTSILNAIYRGFLKSALPGFELPQGDATTR